MNTSNEVGQCPQDAEKCISKPGAETIMVVDDEPDLLDLIVQVLEARGYSVLAAASGKQALEQWSHHSRHIDLLLTDMTMPDGMTGFELAERLRAEDPGLRVLYTSGHTAGVPGTQLADVDEQHFLPKPYRPSTLLEIVRNCLDAKN
jgi:CheY-like chemotaxis protein